MNTLIYLCRGFVALVGILASLTLFVFLHVPVALLLSALARACGLESDMVMVTLGVMVVDCVAGLLIINAHERDDDDRDGGRDGESADAPRPRPTTGRRLLDVPPGLTGLPASGQERFTPTPLVTVTGERVGLDEVTIEDLMPGPDRTATHCIATPAGPVVVIVSRGDYAPGRATAAQHALISGGPRIPVLSN